MVVWFRCSLPRAPSGRVDRFSSFWERFPRIASLPAARTSSGANFVLPSGALHRFAACDVAKPSNRAYNSFSHFSGFEEMEV